MHYNKRDVKAALIELGLREGDIVFSHANLSFFGIPYGGMTEDNVFSIFYDSLFEIIGDTGTWIVPTFTYSFRSNGYGEVFDYKNTPSKMGLLAEKIRGLDTSVRTLDPLFSVSICGNVNNILKNNIISSDCFGKGSIFDLMYKKNIKFVNFNMDTATTYIHYVERELEVDYRKNILFYGKTILDNKIIDHSVFYYCRNLESNIQAEFSKFDKLAMDRNIGRKVKLGRGSISLITAKQTYSLIEEVLPEWKDFLIKRV
ncbi:MAG: AAC(3) family N-acetyltransferase [Arcobacter sp.]|uniref:AAC(3) family N-acetyltransferase n=1 Tax=Arcobacter sp. TaxID=1872629 RepID=UPI003AFFCE24